MTDSRISRVHIEALETVTPNGRISRVLLETLVRFPIDGRISRVHIETLWRNRGDEATVTYWDGATRQPARVRGWWDGTTEQPLKPVQSWVDAAGIRHPLK